MKHCYLGYNAYGVYTFGITSYMRFSSRADRESFLERLTSSATLKFKKVTLKELKAALSFAPKNMYGHKYKFSELNDTLSLLSTYNKTYCKLFGTPYTEIKGE